MVKKRSTKRKPKREPAERAAPPPEESAGTESDEAATSSADDADGSEPAADAEAGSKDDVVDAIVDEPDEQAPSAAARGGAQEEPEPAEETVGATQLGGQRFVIFGFFAAWFVASYVLSKTLEGLWGSLAHRDWFSRALPAVAAVPHEGELVSRSSVGLVAGGILAALLVVVYYRKADVRQWADEVAEQLSKVKWPTRKDVGNNTLIVIAVGAVLTIYLAILDRFWGFVTNLIYTAGM